MVICLFLNWTAYSQITCIPDSTKREIVKTLTDYPLVLQELDIANKTIEELEKQVELLYRIIGLKDGIIISQKKQIGVVEKQRDLYMDESERRKSAGFIYGQLNLNGWTTYGAGFDYVIKMKAIIGFNIQYDSLYDNVNLNVKLGFKIL